MAYSQGGLISAADFNAFASTNTQNLTTVWGTGSGQYGYGQSTTALATLSSGATVTAAQWSGFLTILNNALAHQSGSAAQISGTNYTAGQLITYFSTISTGVTNAYNNHLLYASNGGTSSSGGLNNSITFTQTTGSTTAQTSSFTHTISFANGDAARYFFNCGGYITWTQTASNGNGLLHSADIANNWNTFQSGGAIYATTSTPRTGSGGTVNTAATNLGYWNLTTSPQVLSKVTSTNYRYEYTQDYTQVSVQTNTTNNSGHGDNGYVITLTFLTSDEGKINPSDPANFNDSISVTSTVTFTTHPPETTYLSASWGSPTYA